MLVVPFSGRRDLEHVGGTSGCDDANAGCCQCRCLRCSLSRFFSRSKGEQRMWVWDVLFVFPHQRLRVAGALIRQAHSTPGHFVCLRW